MLEVHKDIDLLIHYVYKELIKNEGFLDRVWFEFTMMEKHTAIY